MNLKNVILLLLITLGSYVLNNASKSANQLIVNDDNLDFPYQVEGIQYSHFEPDNTWRISGHHAHNLLPGKNIELAGGVVIEQYKLETNEKTQLETERMIFNPIKNHAFTHNIVHIFQNRNTLEADGMHVSLTDKRIKLIGKARGYYEPKTS